MPEKNSPVSRRDFARLVTGTAAGVVATATGCAPTEKQKVNTPPPPVKVTPKEETYLPDLGKQLGVNLTPEQIKRLPHALKDIADTSAELRKFPLQDGGSEPGTLFTPIADRP